MTIEEFTCNSSPVDQADDGSTSGLNITELSLPESFDDTFCLDLYKEFASEAHIKKNITRPKEQSPKAFSDGRLAEEDTTHDAEMELKIRQLLATNLELKEKGRLYDSLKTRQSEHEAEVESLSSKLREQASLYESCSSREKGLQHQILEFKRMLHLGKMDLEHAQKEIELLLDRAERAEKENEANASTLKALQYKHESLIARHASEREELKTRTESEISRIRQESSQEIISSRNHQTESFARESKLLSDARDYAFEQAKLLQQELNELRIDRQRKDTETSEITNELERQLADVRSDLKVKACELSTLQASHKRLYEEGNQYKKEAEQNKQALSQLQLEFTKLDRESMIERSKFEETIRQKEDALELYQHDDLLIDDNDPNAASMLVRRKSLVKNSVTLAKRCREFQALLRTLNNELAMEKEKYNTLVLKAEHDKQMYQELTSQSNKNASAYILSAVNERDKEISCLNLKVHAMQSELNATRQERDGLASKLAEILERRGRLEDMKVLVEKGLKQIKNQPSVKDPVAMAGCYHMQEEENCDENEDMLEHMIHHKK